MHYLDNYPIGKGSDLILLHGFAMNAPFLKPLAEKLSSHYRVHLFDLPGFGKAHEKPLPKTIPLLVESLLKHIPIQSAIWLGWSLGGLIATWTALHHPSLVKAVINLNSTPRFLQDVNWPGIAHNAFFEFSHDIQNHYEKSINRFIMLQLPQTHPSFKKEVQDTKNQLKKQPKPNQKTLSAAMQMLAETDLRPKISSIQPACLYLFGEKDRLVPASTMSFIKGNQLRTRLIPEAGHLPFLSHPKVLLAELQTFLGRTDDHR